MIKIFQLFSIIMLISMINLFAVHLGHEDFTDNVAGHTIQKRKIIVDFKKAKPDGLSNLESFNRSLLQNKLLSRINASVQTAGYPKRNLEVHFRNINNENQLAASCLVMKGLGYGKYSNTNPSIFLENDPNSDNSIQTSTDNKRDEYHGGGLI